jgi:hypothetical protein
MSLNEARLAPLGSKLLPAGSILRSLPGNLPTKAQDGQIHGIGVPPPDARRKQLPHPRSMPDPIGPLKCAQAAHASAVKGGKPAVHEANHEAPAWTAKRRSSGIRMRIDSSSLGGPGRRLSFPAFILRPLPGDVPTKTRLGAGHRLRVGSQPVPHVCAPPSVAPRSCYGSRHGRSPPDQEPRWPGLPVEAGMVVRSLVAHVAYFSPPLGTLGGQLASLAEHHAAVRRERAVLRRIQGFRERKAGAIPKPWERRRN